MMLLGKIITFATAVVCLAVLAVSVYPGWLNDLLFFAILIGLVAVPVALVAIAVIVFIRYRCGKRSAFEFPKKYAAYTFVMVFTTVVALWFYLPRRMAFAACRSSFQQFVDGEVVEQGELNQSCGLYRVDACLIDARGGTYLRVYSGADGIGPDVMSYGFCHKPNRKGSPFGAAHYRTFSLGNGWYWFRASDDWF